MRLELTDDGMVLITLSRRNLLTGLHKLDWPGSARTIYQHCPDYDKTLVFRVEDDEEHYSHPSRRGAPAGEMHPVTEHYVEDHA